MKSLTFYTLILLFFFTNASFSQSTGYLSQVGTKDSIFSSVLDQQRRFYVQLPSSYHNQPYHKYPVAIILDGESLLPVVNTFHEFYSGGYMPEMILVGIANDHDRTQDLTPSVIAEKYGMPFNSPTGGADSFLQFLADELIPHIDDTYRTTEFRTIIGHSYGGLFTINSLIERPELFDHYLAIDPSLDWDDELMNKKIEEQSLKSNEQKALYFSLSGQLHMQDASVTIENVQKDTTDFTLFARANINFREALEKNKPESLKTYWEFFENDLHGTVQLPSIHHGLIRLFNWYQMENTDRINSFDTSLEELQQIIQHRADKLEKHFGYPTPPYPEDLLNMSGYMNMDMQQFDKAKMYFELAVKYYPKSANTYDSLAEFYEHETNYKKAYELVSKAYELSGSEYHRGRMETLLAKLK